ncbi:hypothetical protein [Kitasatospora sp. NPDC059160]|uniref:hypothetical protein n=1 Tax=Kitasatospora sp. NPDC059160 TaxID=3346748 RepID=UPI0036888383
MNEDPHGTTPGPGLQLPWIAEEEEGEPDPPHPTAATLAARLSAGLGRLGDRSRWDARRIAMAASMATGAVLLLVAPFIEPDGGSGDPAAAAAPTGRSPLGTHGRAHPPTPAPTGPTEPTAPTAPTGSSADPTGTPTGSPSAAPSPTDDPHQAPPTAQASRPAAPAATTPVPAATPASAAPAAPQAPPAPQPAPGYRAVAGLGCSGPGARFQEVGAFRQGADGWVTVSSGGYGGDSCDGRYDAVPMSGDRAKDDNSTYALWTFDTGPGPASCAVAVYVPDSSSVQQVGGAPAYTVAAVSGADLGSFTVDQVSHRGSWVDAGTFRAQAGPLTVRLHNRGQDWTGSGRATHAHLAAAAVRVTCQG